MPSSTIGQETLRQVVGRWLINPASPDMLPVSGDQGYSGALLWKLTDGGRDYCLRRWPTPAPTVATLQQIHQLLDHLATACPRWIGAPVRSRQGETLCEVSGRLWQLSPWMPGVACPAESCTNSTIAAALATLAEIHQAAESFSTGDAQTLRVAPSPGLAHRRLEITRLLSGGLESLRQAVARQQATQLMQTLDAGLHQLQLTLPGVAEQFERFGDPPIRQQWRIGDVRREHILFDGEKVTGVIDFGAACVDTVAGDVARLLGSMAGDDRERRQAGLSAYESIRPLDEAERRCVWLFDAGGVCVALSNWVRWLAVEQREVDAAGEGDGEGEEAGGAAGGWRLLAVGCWLLAFGFWLCGFAVGFRADKLV